MTGIIRKKYVGVGQKAGYYNYSQSFITVAFIFAELDRGAPGRSRRSKKQPGLDRIKCMMKTLQTTSK